ncbi:MAG: four helix bundle protein [Bacteroidia bacterium]
MGKSIIKEKSFDFAIEIIRLCRGLSEEKREFVLSKQLLRSGTAVGALVREAQNAESTKDFVHKLGIAQKECDESMYWLELLKASGYLKQEEIEIPYKQAGELLKMLRSAIITSKNKFNS